MCLLCCCCLLLPPSAPLTYAHTTHNYTHYKHSSLLNAAKKCGCPFPTPLTFTASGEVHNYRALSCSPSYVASGYTADRFFQKGASASQKASSIRGGAAAGRKLLAANAADQYGYYKPQNTTVYYGRALTVEADIEETSSYGYEHPTKLVYVGGFVDSTPIAFSEYAKTTSGDYLSHLPFITGGTLKLVMKK